MLCINWGVLPLAGQVGFSTCDHWISCQHFKGAGFTRPIHPQQTKALREKRDVNIRTLYVISQECRDSLLYLAYLLILLLHKLFICTIESLEHVVCIVPLQGGCRHTACLLPASVSACKSWWAVWVPGCLTVKPRSGSSVALWPHPRLLLQ